ncbi:hypothetical protein FE839_07855 [Klebsiella indica]|uniref:Uncharacterized protein n=1 Tax=Klebsiella indica TaxID=2582917 RepID=A0A5R9LJT5_9ENTR|nr:hypothetical protein FE839_07855 [Klebsiella indica]
MLYRYAIFSRKHNTLHIVLLFSILLISFIHLSVLLETDNTWLLLPMVIYLPIFFLWQKVSVLRSRIAD